MPASDPSLGDWAAAAGALFAAVATGAALLTARQGRQALEASQRPFVEVQVLADADTAMLRLAIINTGQGVARGTNYAVHALGSATDGLVKDGFLQSGQKFHVASDIGPLPTPTGKIHHDLADLAVMVVYRDTLGYVHYRTHFGNHYTPRTFFRRRPKYPDRVDTFKKLYPAINIETATRANSWIEKPA